MVPHENCRKVSKNFLTLFDDFWLFFALHDKNCRKLRDSKRHLPKGHSWILLEYHLNFRNFTRILLEFHQNVTRILLSTGALWKGALWALPRKSVEKLFDTSWRFLRFFDVAPFRRAPFAIRWVQPRRKIVRLVSLSVPRRQSFRITEKGGWV